MGLAEMVSRGVEGEDLSGSVSITFDDGYYDNYEYATPLLERKCLPATVFVASKNVDRASEFWWDELEGLLLEDREYPDALALEAAGREMVWKLGPVSHFEGACWSVLDRANLTPNQRAYVDLCEVMRGMKAEEREGVLERIRRQLSVKRSARSSHRVMSSEELERIARSDFIELGLHTESHTDMSLLSRAEQLEEMERSRCLIEGFTRKGVESASYPFGMRSTYNNDTISILKNMGIRYACSNYPAYVTGRTDPYQLPRVVVRDMPGEDFRGFMRAITGGGSSHG